MEAHEYDIEEPSGAGKGVALGAVLGFTVWSAAVWLVWRAW